MNEISMLYRRAPDGRKTCRVKDDAVPDFVEEIHAPKSCAAEHDVPVLCRNLLVVDVHDDQQHGYDVPLERERRISQNFQRAD